MQDTKTQNRCLLLAFVFSMTLKALGSIFQILYNLDKGPKLISKLNHAGRTPRGRDGMGRTIITSRSRLCELLFTTSSRLRICLCDGENGDASSRSRLLELRLPVSSRLRMLLWRVSLCSLGRSVDYKEDGDAMTDSDLSWTSHSFRIPILLHPTAYRDGCLLVTIERWPLRFFR